MVDKSSPAFQVLVLLLLACSAARLLFVPMHHSATFLGLSFPSTLCWTHRQERKRLATGMHSKSNFLLLTEDGVPAIREVLTLNPILPGPLTYFCCLQSEDVTYSVNKTRIIFSLITPLFHQQYCQLFVQLYSLLSWNPSGCSGCNSTDLSCCNHLMILRRFSFVSVVRS